MTVCVVDSVFFFCFVLFFFLFFLFCFVLFLFLFCFVLFCFVLFCFVSGVYVCLFCFVLFCLLLYQMYLFCSFLFCSVFPSVSQLSKGWEKLVKNLLFHLTFKDKSPSWKNFIDPLSSFKIIGITKASNKEL